LAQAGGCLTECFLEGLPGIKVSIITVLPWQPTVKVVTNMKHGRFF